MPPPTIDYKAHVNDPRQRLYTANGETMSIIHPMPDTIEDHQANA